MLTNLDITCKQRLYLHRRPFAYYLCYLLCVAMNLGGMAVDAAAQYKTDADYATLEYGIYPDAHSGLPMSQAGKVAHPEYFVLALIAQLSLSVFKP